MSRLGGAGAVAQLVADVPLSVKVTLTRIYNFRLGAHYEIIQIEIVVHFHKLFNPFRLHRTEQRHSHSYQDLPLGFSCSAITAPV